ncbi:hypothetical protein [Ferviditalea candida]|uniref:Transposase n=1 Tax=Ferviditalea candida TaxID=3108399 RepID=A0ABU5ZL10_9BACL|nr:hypothetical protein [Paenibacillaceae bacterium T2]
MSRILSHLDEINVIGKLADLKEEHYRSLLILNGLIELLIEKGILTEQELRSKMSDLDTIHLRPHPQPPIS